MLDEASGAEARLEITSVQRLNAGAVDPLVRYAVDGPKPGATSDLHDFTLAGWALHPERSITAIQVVAYGETIGWGRVQIGRPDVAQAFPNVPQAMTAGFHFTAGVVGLPVDFECDVEACLDDGRRVPLARLEGRRSPVVVDDGEYLRPLLVTSLGRSGSTYLMGLLAGHPGIVTDRAVPYETRTSAYWTQVFKVLSRPANYSRAGDPDTFVYNRHFVGQNPFYFARRGEPGAVRAWYGQTTVERLADFCRATIDSFYRMTARLNGQDNPRYYAEKRLESAVIDPWLDLYRGGREIFLVRDFRDTLASILAFNAKRGYQAFGRENAGSDEEYVGVLQSSARAFYEAWKRRGTMESLVRYEDLAASPREALPRILDHLGLDSSETIIDDMIARVESAAELREHRTTESATSSIGRWQTDLDDGLKAACDEAFGGILAELGYAVPAT
ncbi:MAG TPA: sulfotransferase [Candidatus Dormibacteraeota bacterium]|nr:sulfotransferase [Candidatus Dormibacteraeota bacterium]